MSSNRDTFNSSVKTAVATEVATKLTNEIVRQTTVDASASVAGYNLQTGNYANLKTAHDNARKAKLAADMLAEQTKQAALAAARDTLRATGDLAPF
jgi:hypothetical protein